MKSKLFTLLFTFLVINSVTFALGAGIQIDSIPVLNFDLQKEADAPSKEFGCVLTGTFKMERIPLTVSLGLKAGILNGKSSYGLSANADYSFINAQIINHVKKRNEI